MKSFYHYVNDLTDIRFDIICALDMTVPIYGDPSYIRKDPDLYNRLHTIPSGGIVEVLGINLQYNAVLVKHFVRNHTSNIVNGYMILEGLPEDIQKEIREIRHKLRREIDGGKYENLL